VTLLAQLVHQANEEFEAQRRMLGTEWLSTALQMPEPRQLSKQFAQYSRILKFEWLKYLAQAHYTEWPALPIVQPYHANPRYCQRPEVQRTHQRRPDLQQENAKKNACAAENHHLLTSCHQSSR
jgi:hypothetical protein